MVAAKAPVRDLPKASESVMHPLKDQGMESGPCCDNISAPKPISAAVRVCYETASLFDNERPGCDIVGAQM